MKTTGCGWLIAACLAFAPGLRAQDSLEGDFSTRPAIEKRPARSEISSLPADADPALRDHLQQLAAVCQYHLAAVGVLSKAQQASDHAAQELSSWHGLTQQPPYSILQLDELRESIAMLADARRAAEVQLRILNTEAESARNQLDDHQEAGRRFSDTAQSAATPEARQRTESDAKVEDVASRIATEAIARLGLRLEAEQAELAMIKSQSELAQLELEAKQGKTTFSQQDLAAIQQRIAKERAESVAALTAASSGSSEPNPLLVWKTEFLDLEKSFWDARFAALNRQEPAIRKQSRATLNQLKSQVDDWIEIAKLRLAGGATKAAEIDPAQLRDSLQRASRIQRRIGFAITDLDGSHPDPQVLDRIKAALLSFWNAELYLAEETDIVEADGIIGRIRRIGLRASIVRHFDGIDTLIPNSTLLENRVTNWTLSDSLLRHFVLVGVAYGSPTREVSHILLAVAAEHGLVLRDPAPEIRFEDFGDNALQFRLLFWFDSTKTQRDPLASDLRFMIDKALAEAGIAIAYPQRDIHLDTAAPLRVELSRPPKIEPERGA
ncbi:MAG: mechanosensitive ion channel [Akkermansiaceae bacterium]|nr:mechanosensitive ion channel [Akkermansiaceae bacterium]